MAQIIETHREARVRSSGRSSLWLRWALFVGIGIALYAALYLWAENLVYRTGEKNRFFMVATAPLKTYDFVILGASHAMPLGFEDMNEQLQSESGASIINLSNEGAGILPNRIVYDYFRERHEAANVIYVLDSFVFNSPAWNEERVHDAGFFKRAPLDPALASVLWRHSWARSMLPGYLSGFGKINNEDRFERDLPEAELTKFKKVYRSSPKIDAQRIAYLYPPSSDSAAFDRYFAEFEALADRVAERGGEFIVVRPPTPPRYRDKLPDQNGFDRRLAALAGEKQIPLYDFSASVTEDAYFYDTDHLNRDGVLAFAKQGFVTLLQKHK